LKNVAIFLIGLSLKLSACLVRSYLLRVNSKNHRGRLRKLPCGVCAMWCG